MIRTFIIGVVLGLVAAAGALYAIPVVDQVREESITRVAPNGGNVEVFRIDIPTDRVMATPPGQAEPVPPGLKWPNVEKLADVRTEMFKVRNVRQTFRDLNVAVMREVVGDRSVDEVLRCAVDRHEV